MKEFIVQIDETKVPEEFIKMMEASHKELVRCDDCIKWNTISCDCDESFLVFPDHWFCAGGERKEE